MRRVAGSRSVVGSVWELNRRDCVWRKATGTMMIYLQPSRAEAGFWRWWSEWIVAIWSERTVMTVSWVLATVRNVKGHRKSNRRRFEGMRRVAIWNGYRCGYRRFGVGIGVYLTVTVYLQSSRAKASPLSLISDSWAQRRRWLGSSSPKGVEVFFFFLYRKSDCLFCGSLVFLGGQVIEIRCL